MQSELIILSHEIRQRNHFKDSRKTSYMHFKNIITFESTSLVPALWLISNLRQFIGFKNRTSGFRILGVK